MNRFYRHHLLCFSLLLVVWMSAFPASAWSDVIPGGADPRVASPGTATAPGAPAQQSSGGQHPSDLVRGNLNNNLVGRGLSATGMQKPLGGSLFYLNTYTLLEPVTAGTDSVHLTATLPSQPWTASSRVSWLHLPVTSGLGSATVDFGFDENPGPRVRVNALIIADQTLTVTQAAPSYVIGTTNFSESAGAGSDTMSLTVTPSFGVWTAVANSSWLHVTNSGGTGSSNITFSFDANPGGPRTGSLTVGGERVSVSQAPADISFPLVYANYYGAYVWEVSAEGGAVTLPITVTPAAGQWNCRAGTEGWIHVNTANGTGPTNLSFTLDPNTNRNAGVRSSEVSLYNYTAQNNSYHFNTQIKVFQAAPSPGTNQITYRFTGRLTAFRPQDVPDSASAALKSVADGDVFYLSMTLLDNAPFIYYANYACAVNHIVFSVPSRSLTYSRSFANLEVLQDGSNPSTLRWDANGVDSSVNMIFWARDFSKTALIDGSIPDPLNLTGFHGGSSFAHVILFRAGNGNPELFYGNLVPMPNLNFEVQGNTNKLWWVTSDLSYSPILQTTTNLADSAEWQVVTNVPTLQGLTNTVRLPVNSTGAQFFRLKVL